MTLVGGQVAVNLLYVASPETLGSTEEVLEPLGAKGSNPLRRAMYGACGSHPAYPTGSAC